MGTPGLCISANTQFCADMDEQIRLIADAGFDGIFFPCEPGDPAGEWIKTARLNGLKVHSLHAPFTGCAALWEEETDMAAAKDRLRHMIADLKRTLSSIGMEHILVRRSGQLAIVRDRVSCDFYRMLDGDMDIVNTFDGEYMSQYSWAELTTGRLVFRKDK